MSGGFVIFERRSQPIRDYIYVSKLKNQRLGTALPKKILARLKGVDMKVGPVGAGLTLGDQENVNIVKLAQEVDAEVRRSYTVYSPEDLSVRSNHYIGGTIKMAYGVQKAYGDMPTDAAIFVGFTNQVCVYLVGSASNMLDRYSLTDVGEGGMSAPEVVYGFMAQVARDDNAGKHYSELQYHEARPLVSYPVDRAAYHFHQSGFEPMPLNFLARVYKVADISGDTRGGPRRYVVGSPLWVTSDVPD